MSPAQTTSSNLYVVPTTYQTPTLNTIDAQTHQLAQRLMTGQTRTIATRQQPHWPPL